MQQQPADFLSPEKLQLFVAGLSGLAPEEVRKAKLLYLRNAISEFQAMQASFQGFGQAQGCMSICAGCPGPLQGGAPSHVDLFDYKPALEKWNGKPPPEDDTDKAKNRRKSAA